MKFKRGLWLMQKDIQPLYAVEAYRISETQDSIDVLAAASHIENRGGTLGPALNVRVSPSVKAKKLGTLKKGTQVNLLKLNGDWAQIYYKGKSGWVAVKYLGK